MGNPKNTGTYTGRVVRSHFIRDSKGIPFQLRFIIKINRLDTGNNGEKIYDYLQMRITGQKKMSMAKRIKEGDLLTIIGDLRSESYMKNGKPVYGMYVNVEMLTWLANGRPNYSFDEDGIPAPPLEELPFG